MQLIKRVLMVDMQDVTSGTSMQCLMKSHIDDVLGALARLGALMKRTLDFVLSNGLYRRLQFHALFWRQGRLNALKGKKIVFGATQVDSRLSLTANKRTDKRDECTGQ